METKNRNGVLGLETAKQVMITFLILAVTGVAILLALTSLQTSVGSTIDTLTAVQISTNESDNGGSVAFLNNTGYKLTNSNSSTSSYVITAIWVSNDTGYPYNASINTANASINSSGYVFNTSTVTYGNVSFTYYLTYTYDSGRTTSIIGNVSNGLVTFFGSTGTIFSILIVVIIILAISIIIWAVGRFGQQAESTENVRL